MSTGRKSGIICMSQRTSDHVSNRLRTMAVKSLWNCNQATHLFLWHPCHFRLLPEYYLFHFVIPFPVVWSAARNVCVKFGSKHVRVELFQPFRHRMHLLHVFSCQRISRYINGSRGASSQLINNRSTHGPGEENNMCQPFGTEKSV